MNVNFLIWKSVYLSLNVDFLIWKSVYLSLNVDFLIWKSVYLSDLVKPRAYRFGGRGHVTTCKYVLCEHQNYAWAGYTKNSYKCSELYDVREELRS